MHGFTPGTLVCPKTKKKGTGNGAPGLYWDGVRFPAVPCWFGMKSTDITCGNMVSVVVVVVVSSVTSLVLSLSAGVGVSVQV